MRTKKPTFSELHPFDRAYITAAFWTEDEGAPSGDYETSGRPELLYQRLTASSVRQVVSECHAFRNGPTIAAALGPTGDDDAQPGHDFWLTRNGHGTGFWDRDYDETVASTLTSVAKAAGERYLDFYKGRIYYL